MAAETHSVAMGGYLQDAASGLLVPGKVLSSLDKVYWHELLA